MTDPYFQQLFADRIGGAEYGKSTAIYKFEKIKRAKRRALKPSFPTARYAGLRHRRKRRDGARVSVRTCRWPRRSTVPENRGYADNGVDEFKAGRRAVHGASARRHTRPPDRGEPRHRLQERVGDSAGVLSSTRVTSR